MSKNINRFKVRFKRIIATRSACVYCGAMAQCREHYMCWSVNRVAYWLPACNNCNMLLSDKVHTTLAERCMYISGRLRHTHRKHIKADYSARLEGTKGSIRAAVHKAIAAQQELKERLYFLDLMAAMSANVNLSTLHCDQQAIDLIDAVMRQVELEAASDL